MNIVFLMEPLDTVDIKKNTTFKIALAAQAKGYTVFYIPNGGLSRKNGKLYFHAQEVIPQENQDLPFIQKDWTDLSEDQVDAVFIRNDPPFNEQYLMNTWLLDLLPEGFPVINKPSGIRSANEKIWAMQFTDITPRTLVSRRQKELICFLNEEEEMIVKPTDGFGGQSVFHIKRGERNAMVTLETMTSSWSKDIIAQQFIPEANDGDKRILLLDGEPLGAVLRLHSENDHRNNFFAGGKPLSSEITKRDEEIIAVLKPHLKALGLYFVGIDILGDCLVEVNVTSPTCLQEMNRLFNLQLEEKVIDFLDNKIKLYSRNKSISV